MATEIIRETAGGHTIVGIARAVSADTLRAFHVAQIGYAGRWPAGTIRAVYGLFLDALYEPPDLGRETNADRRPIINYRLSEPAACLWAEETLKICRDHGGDPQTTAYGILVVLAKNGERGDPQRVRENAALRNQPGAMRPPDRLRGVR